MPSNFALQAWYPARRVKRSGRRAPESAWQGRSRLPRKPRGEEGTGDGDGGTPRVSAGCPGPYQGLGPGPRPAADSQDSTGGFLLPRPIWIVPMPSRCSKSQQEKHKQRSSPKAQQKRVKGRAEEAEFRPLCPGLGPAVVLALMQPRLRVADLSWHSLATGCWRREISGGVGCTMRRRVFVDERHHICTPAHGTWHTGGGVAHAGGGKARPPLGEGSGVGGPS